VCFIEFISCLEAFGIHEDDGCCRRWPLISKVGKDFFSDCGCSLTKRNKRKKVTWGNGNVVLPEENSFAMDLYSYGTKTYLSTLNLKTEKF
jgi:hypothetical protein